MNASTTRRPKPTADRADGPTVAPPRFDADRDPAAPTLARTAGCVGHNVAQSHEWVDRIEMVLFGPVPDGDAFGCTPPTPSGLTGQLDSVAASSSSLAVRLSRIAERLGD